MLVGCSVPAANSPLKMAQAHRAVDHATVALSIVTRMTVVEGHLLTRVMEMVKRALELNLDRRRKECLLCRDRNINRYLPGGMHSQVQSAAPRWQVEPTTGDDRPL